MHGGNPFLKKVGPINQALHFESSTMAMAMAMAKSQRRREQEREREQERIVKLVGRDLTGPAR
jgi:hypothetical protein